MSQNIVIKILADDKTKKAFSGVEKRFSAMGAAAKKMAKIGVAAFAAVTAAITALTVASMKNIDSIAKTSDKLGIATEKLIGLQFAAEQSGVSTETMNMALQRFTRRVAEAAGGSGEAVGALKELGLNAEGLMTLPLDVQMGYVADAMAGVETQADKVRLAMKLFDSEGVALVNTLAGGSAGLDAMAQKAETLGITLSRVDAAKVEMANDALNTMRMAAQGVGNQFAIALAPAIWAASEGVVDLATNTESWHTMGERTVRAVLVGYGTMLNYLKELKQFFMFLEVTTNKWGIAIQKTVIYWNNLINPLSYLIKGVNYLNKLIGNGPLLPDPFIGLEEANKKWVKINADLEANLKASIAEPPPLDGLVATYDKRAQMMDDLTAKYIENKDIENAKDAEQRKLQWDIATKLSEVTVTAKRKDVKILGQTMEEKKKIARDSAEAGLKTLGQTNKKMFAISKAYDIAKAVMSTYTAATTTLAAYPGPIGIAMAAVTVAAGLANVAQIRAQSFEGGGFTGYGARAGGLDGKGGRMAMVHPNETVIDHTKGQQVGGGGNTVNFNIAATDASGFDELLMSRRGEIMSMIDEAMNDDGRSL